MPDKETSAPLVWRVAPRVLGVNEPDGCVYVIAPVGEPEGPFRISIIKLEETGERPEFKGSWPISDSIAAFPDAIARLHVGFELSMPPADFEEPTRSLLARVISEGMLLPVTHNVSAN